MNAHAPALAQIIIAPGGARMAVIPEAEYLRLIAADEDTADHAAAIAGLESLRREGGIPAEVAYAIMDGSRPIAAWRAFRGMSQAQLAEKAGVTQAAVARIELAPSGAGRPATRRAIADALGAPLWTLDGTE